MSTFSSISTVSSLHFSTMKSKKDEDNSDYDIFQVFICSKLYPQSLLSKAKFLIDSNLKKQSINNYKSSLKHR